MRIAYLFQNVNTDYSITRAEQIHVLFTVRELQNLGLQAELVAPQGRKVIYSPDLPAITNKRLSDSNFATTPVSSTAWFSVFEKTIRRLQTFLHLPYLAIFESFHIFEAITHREPECELLHERFHLPAFGGYLAKRRRGVPYLLEMNADLIDQRNQRGDPETGIRKLLSTWNTKACFHSADIILCTSTVLAEHLSEHWQVPKDKFRVLPCAADVTAFSQEYPVAEIRRSLGLADEPILIWVGGYHIWQDIDILLDGLAIVKQANPSVILIMVGDGPLHEKFRQQVRERALENSVLDLGYIPHNRVPEIMAIADLAVNFHPASIAGFSGAALKLFEYMAAGKAIITTDLPQVSEVITDGYSGILIPPGDVASFVHATERLLENAEERKRLGDNARQLALEKHSWNGYAQQLEEIYRSMVEKTPGT